MTANSFSEAFDKLKAQLDDPNARFVGDDMRDALLSLQAKATDPASIARLFRELAILEAKRDELVCLDHAEKAQAAHGASNALKEQDLYFMHLICGDVATMWEGGPRTRTHLDEALRLHTVLSRPIGESLAIRRNLGVYMQGLGDARFGLDWFEPLLAEAEAHYGHGHPELDNLLYLMSVSEDLSGRTDAALDYAKKRLNALQTASDPGRSVSAMIMTADLLLKRGDKRQAREMLDAAVTLADAECSDATQSFAQQQRDARFPSFMARVRSLLAKPQA